MPGIGIGISTAFSSGGPGFTPVGVSGCALWLRADLGITVTGAGVSSWVDQAAGHTFVQGTDANRPAYQATTAALGGQASLDFVAGSKELAQAGTVTGDFNSSTFFFAYNEDLGTLDGNGACLLNATTGPRIIYSRNLSDLLGYFDGTHRNGDAPASGAQVLTLTLTGSVGTWRRNGVELATTATFANTFALAGTVQIGNRSAGTASLQADLAEIAAYTRALSAAEVAQVEGYMMARYGL